MLSSDEKQAIVEKLSEEITSSIYHIEATDEGWVATVDDDQGRGHEIEISLTYLNPVDEEEEDEPQY